MPKLRNAASGVVVTVSDSTASRLGPDWVSADVAPDPAPAPVKRKPGRPKKQG